MKKIAALILVSVLLLALLSGCGGGTAGDGANSGAKNSADVLYHSYHSQPYITLDPSTEYSNGIMVLCNVYETLTYYNSDTGELEPKLAKSWSSNEDGTVWTFELRDDVTFHDGTPMTSANVKASLERTISLGRGASFNWDPVDTIETNGDYEVIIKCKNAAPIDLIASAGYAAFIMSDEAIGHDTEWFNAGNDGGTGPYMIDSAENNTTVVLKAYEGYRGGWNDSQYKVILIKESTESSVRRQLLETGEAHISDSFSSTDLDALRQETDKVHPYDAKTWSNAIVFLNTQKYPCDNQDFRKALQYSFPYQETVEGVMDGTAVQSVGMVPAGMWGHSDEVFKYTTDLDKAKEYLNASGVDISNLTLTVTYGSSFPEYSSSLQLWQENLNKLGIKLDLRSMEWDAQWSAAQATKSEDRQDIFVMRWWPDYASPASWFDSLVKSEETPMFNLAYINNPDLDKLIDEADSSVANDRAHAEETYIKIQQILADEAYMINIFDDNRAYIVSNSIDGVAENPAYTTVVNYYNVVKS